MREVDVSWKRATDVAILMSDCIREANSFIKDLDEKIFNLEEYTEEMKDIIRIRMEEKVQATTIDCTVDDIECNADELEGHLDNAFSQIENLKDNLKRLKKGE